jgi:hypothetical protein
MASRSGRRRVDHSSPLVDLDDVFADDAFIDAIATRPWDPHAGPWDTDNTAGGGLADHGRHRTPGSADTAEPLTELFGNWRRELAQTPIPDVPSIPKTIDVVSRPKPKRSHRPALAVAAAIAALLVGSTFVGSRQATEGSALWNVTAVLWPDRVESVASRDKVRSAIEVAQVALKENRAADAQAALLDASFEIGKVDEADGRQYLQSSLEGLWKQAAPASTAPSSAEQNQLAAGGSSTSTTRAATTTAPQQVAAVVPPLATTPPLTGVQIAAPDPVNTGQGSAGPAEGIGGSPGAGGVPSLTAGEGATVIAAAPGTGSEVPVSGSDTPSATAEPPVTPMSPSTDQPTVESPTSSTEPAPAPTPSLPTSTVDVPATADSAGEQSADALTADSSSIDTAASTPVLPTP